MEERKLNFEREENLVKGTKLFKINKPLSTDVLHVIIKKKPNEITCT